MENRNGGGVEEFVEHVMSLQPRISQAWVNVDGVSDLEGTQELKVHWKDVLMSGVEPQLGTLRLRDPNEFIAGGLHTNPNAWELVLSHHPLAEEILGWIRHKVDILLFSQPFSGSYKGVHYHSDLPLARRFVNHASCKRFSEFVSLEIKKRLVTGAVRVWGKVGVSTPPHVVLPLTVEPTKPCLCIDARFVNL